MFKIIDYFEECNFLLDENFVMKYDIDFFLFMVNRGKDINGF